MTSQRLGNYIREVYTYNCDLKVMKLVDLLFCTVKGRNK